MVKIKRKGQQYIIRVDADSYKYEYVMNDLELARERACKLKLMLDIK